jgi:hypothetical protein
MQTDETFEAGRGLIYLDAATEFDCAAMSGSSRWEVT